MSSPATARIACATPQFVQEAEPAVLTDWLRYFDSDVIAVTGNSPAPRATSRLRSKIRNEQIFHPAGFDPLEGPYVISDVQFVFAPTVESLRKIPDYEGDELDSSNPTFVLSGLLELEIDTTALSTSLAGREEYVAAFKSESVEGEYIHVSTRLPLDYRREWEGLTVIGAGVDAGQGDTPLASLDCRDDGTIQTRSMNRSQLGLRGVDQVGTKRAKNLRDAGITSRKDIVDANLGTLSELPGVGRNTAERIQQSAEATVHDEVVRKSDAQLPTGDPVYIDIETDGLDPTVTWLIGVLDGTAAEGHYKAFIQKDPDESGRTIENFMAWYTETANNRPLVAYNGFRFDFEVIHDHIIQYCPQYEDAWTSTYRFDPYQWAVEEGNAALPGRTNKLEDVASALGYERAATELTGAAVARAYQQWMVDQSTSTEPDWEQFKSYCEDDVRGLATIYEALQESGRISSSGESSPHHPSTTTQGSLSDW